MSYLFYHPNIHNSFIYILNSKEREKKLGNPNFRHALKFLYCSQKLSSLPIHPRVFYYPWGEIVYTLRIMTLYSCFKEDIDPNVHNNTVNMFAKENAFQSLTSITWQYTILYFKRYLVKSSFNSRMFILLYICRLDKSLLTYSNIFYVYFSKDFFMSIFSKEVIFQFLLHYLNNANVYDTAFKMTL